MATKRIAWNTGSGNITLTYQGQGDGPISVQSDKNDGAARSQIITIETTAEYPFAIQFAVPANTDVDPKTCQIVVTDEGGNAYTCLITLAAGDAYLTVGEPSGELNWDGSNTVTVAVQSNTTWGIE